MATFWTRKKRRAALRVAEDTLTDSKIAAEAGVAKVTLEMWKRRPEFRVHVDELVQEFADAIKAKGIADRQNRVDALNDRWLRMQRVIDARAEAHPTDEDAAPGVETGLMVRQEKQIGAGKNAVRVIEWKVDDGLLNELRQHEKQAAQELGQWTEKSDLTTGGKALSFTLQIDRGDDGDDEADDV